MTRTFALVVLVVAVLLVLITAGWVWWNSGPSATSEVRAYFASTGRAGVVDVGACEYSEDPRPPSQYPETTVFLCEIDSDRRIRLRFGRVIPQGRSFYCFRVPRSAARFERSDHRASPYGVATRPDSCFSRL